MKKQKKNTLKNMPIGNFGIRSSEELNSAELSFSSLFARELDRFLLTIFQDGACLHQGPLKKSPSIVVTQKLQIGTLQDLTMKVYHVKS